ncbi:MAG: hypothetical protein LQ337_000256 [Flavoplaca oasis]|nr:MAG: hypothetical protein LQ337_000256 [Flavoplaca oasis]
MARAQAQDSDADDHYSSRHRGRDGSEDDEQPVYDYEKRPGRGQSHQKSRAREPSYVEDEEEDEEDSDDRHKKQMVIRQKSKKGKSSGKELARRKHRDSDESSSDSSSSDEEAKRKEKERKKKKKSKKKSKAGDDDDEETIKISKWELIHRSEVDRDFIELIADELQHGIPKILDWIENDYFRRHTQTGEYNIDLLFEKGVLGSQEKDQWNRVIKKCKGSPHLKRSLYSSTKTGDVGIKKGYNPNMGLSMRSMGASVHPLDREAHYAFHPGCPACNYFNDPCGYY